MDYYLLHMHMEPSVIGINTFNQFGPLCDYINTLSSNTLITIYIDGTYCNNLPIIGPGSFHLPHQVLFQGLSIAIPSLSSIHFAI